MTTATANATASYPAPDIAAAIVRALAAARDRPNPVFDVGCSPQKYAGMARNFRASAWEHLGKGDLPQASNKAWGLVAETVKAISAHHGGIHPHPPGHLPKWLASWPGWPATPAIRTQPETGSAPSF